MVFERLQGILPGLTRRAALPQALIIGAQKCGTTALSNYLAQHSRLLCARQKELEFFGSDRRFALGLEWYAAQWPEKPRKAIRFEASPQYLAVARAAARVRTCLPAVRLVALVRDPVERA